jgi:hypothetical protein
MGLAAFPHERPSSSTRTNMILLHLLFFKPPLSILIYDCTGSRVCSLLMLITSNLYEPE